MVFMIIGYQTALFVHQAAVMKIAANRDEPDTVYVYPEQYATYNGSYSTSDRTVKSARKNANHSQRAQTVRNNVQPRHVENFRFNPNTVTEEDLCRLGFSPKQAASIAEYRNKGGKFRRKSAAHSSVSLPALLSFPTAYTRDWNLIWIYHLLTLISRILPLLTACRALGAGLHQRWSHTVRNSEAIPMRNS